MTSHGFGGARAGSEIADRDLEEITRRISRVPGVIWAHAVQGPSYNIMFEYAHLHKLERTTDDLKREILEVSVNGKGVHAPIDFWTILHSCQQGKPLEKEDPEHMEK